MRYLPAVLLGRLARVLIRQFRKGGGSALPGLILSKIAPGLLAKTLSRFKDGLVVVTGSAGKSTTTKMLVGIARAHSKVVFTNPSTANILQGFYSTIIEQSNIFGRINADMAILEMDEAHAAALTKRIKPSTVAILNVMEDQLDRFVDPALVRETLTNVAKRAKRHVVLNADDQNMRIIGREPNLNGLSWFGIQDDILKTQRNGLGTAPTYLEDLPRDEVSSEVVQAAGAAISVSVAGEPGKLTLGSRGLHFAVDAICALETARVVLGSEFDLDLACSTISDLPPVFARGEVVQLNGEDVEFVLVQNPGSMQLNLDNLTTNPEQIMFAIGRDVHDPSWLWTVDMQGLSHVDVVAGYNAAEAALLLSYNDVPFGVVEYDLDRAIEAFFALPKPKHGMKTVIFSADSMRRMRRILGFWSPDEVTR
jgi:UDP-N-acetylmuramyl pentapeptide synthase